MNKVYIDFETRSEIDIWKSGAYTYASHPSTKILCICYAVNDEPVKLINQEEIVLGLIPEELKAIAKDSDYYFAAHNAFFERMIWKFKLLEYISMVPLNRWKCTVAKVCQCGLPKSLEKASLALELSQIKDTEGKRIMLKLAKPRRARKNEDPKVIHWHNDEKDFQRLYDYCKQDVLTERELDKKLPDLSEIEQKIWILDQIINERGVQIDQPAVKTILFLIHEYEKKLTKEVIEITKGFIDKVSRRARVLTWINAQGISLLNTQKQTISDLLKNPDLPKKVHRVLEIKQQLSRTSTAKYQAMINAITEDNRLRDILIYHSASTGRWGGKLVQLHNLPVGILENSYLAIDILKEKNLALAEMMYPDLMGAVASCIRGMIISKPKHDLIVADYSSIEARILVWLAGDTKTIAKYKKGVDIYVDMAKEIYGIETINKHQRALGKQAILGCGYGMGATKFLDTCATYGVDINEDLAKRTIAKYRSIYYKVKNMWYAQEEAANFCTKSGKQKQEGCVIWRLENSFLTCQLPSNRKLYYYKPKLEMVVTPWGEKKEALTYLTVNSQTKQLEKTNTYGGKIVENITQAVARDVMAWAMCRCEKAGYKVILTIHDEIIAEVPEHFGSVDEFIKLLTKPLVWAVGCPIAAEGWRGKRYRK